MKTIHVFPDMDRLASEATLRILEIGNQAIDRQGVFTLVLSGGATPQPIYRRLALAGDKLDWSRVHVFWGDERCVPSDDPQSNYGMVQSALLAELPIPDDHIHRIKGELPAEYAAEDYQHRITIFYKNHPRLAWLETPSGRIPAFDLILLGMGSDGHTASLFPNSFALEESLRWVVGITHNQPPMPEVDRVTFSLPLINAAAYVIFLVSGEGKAMRLEQVLSDEGEQGLPAQRVRPVSGQLIWMIDRPAASRLQGIEVRSA